MKRLSYSFFLALLLITTSQTHCFKTEAANVGQTVATVAVIEDPRPNVPDANQVVPINTNSTASRGQPLVWTSLPQTNTAPLAWWLVPVGLLMIGTTILFYKKRKKG